MERASTVVRRCAVYTRKSSEEGLEQDFNSQHAQREACEAFIKSQQGEGWRLVKTKYDVGAEKVRDIEESLNMGSGHAGDSACTGTDAGNQPSSSYGPVL